MRIKSRPGRHEPREHDETPYLRSIAETARILGVAPNAVTEVEYRALAKLLNGLADDPQVQQAFNDLSGE
jgi:hypothetical protein